MFIYVNNYIKRMNDEQEKLDIIKQYFDKYDDNKNGVLEKNEFVNSIRELIQLLGEKITSNMVEIISEEAIEKFDLNGNGVLEFNEFTELMNFFVEEKGLKLSKL